MSKAFVRFSARLAVLVALVGAGLGFVGVGIARAVSTFTVNSTLDEASSSPGSPTCDSTPSHVCTLRAAISAANVGGGVVHVPDGHYVLTIAPAANDDDQSGDLNISANDYLKKVTIVGDVANPAAVVIDGNGTSAGGGSRVFNINSESFTTISGVTITNGNPTNDTAITDQFNGGGILTNGSLSLSHSIVTANGVHGGGNGGGIDVTAGGLYLDSVTVSDNGNVGTAPLDGGGIELATGGAIENSTISGNTAQQEGAGVDHIGNGTLDVTDTTISGNTVQGVGSASGGGFFDNSSPSDSFVHDTISNNHAPYGGGVFNDHGVVITVADSTISGNVAGSGGGGGFYLTANPSTMNITGSTITGNTTTNGGLGGGILNVECDTVNLTNDTIVANTASGAGGGFYGDTGAGAGGACGAGQAVNLLFDTVGSNTAGAGAGDLELQANATSTLTDSIVATGTPMSCLVGASASLTSGGYNLLSGPSCGTPAGTDLTGQNLHLGSLANNGGPTLTELPGPTSPAINAIPSAACAAAAVSTDQRGVTRRTSGNCTIGAVEVNNDGYWEVGADGGVFNFHVPFYGSLGGMHLAAPIVGMAADPATGGYWLVGADGGVFTFHAPFYGSLGGMHLAAPIVAMAADPATGGYWLVGADGGVFTFHAPFHGSLGGTHLAAPIVGMAADPATGGYWLVGADGGVFNFDAPFDGSWGGRSLLAPVVGMAADTATNGYWLALADGRVYPFDAPYRSIPGVHIGAPVVGTFADSTTGGYRLVAKDGGMFCFTAPYFGSMGGVHLAAPVVGMAAPG